MENTIESPLEIQSQEIHTQKGNLYAQRWHAPQDGNTAASTIILMHDSLGCIPIWREFPARLALATGLPVIAYDRLGFGRSDPHPEKLAADFINDEINSMFPKLLEAFEIDRFVACGHSVGGAMAVIAAASYPDRCDALITMGAQVFVEELTLSGIRKAKDDFAKPENLARLDKYHGAKSRWVVDAWTDTWLSREFSTWHAREELARVSCPTLAIHGDSDPYGSTEHARVITEGRGTAEILSGIGHVPYRESEEETLQLIQSFIARAVPDTE